MLSAPGPNATSLSVQIETGNRPALRALIGASQNQVFAVDGGTRFLIWAHGVPHTGSSAELQAGDWVTVRIRAAGGATLQQIESTPAARVADTAPPRAHRPLWLFSGTVAGPQAGGRIALHVQSGNWKALQAMLGQPLDQSFAYDDETIFLLWQGGVPTVIDPSQLQPGDTITVRIRAPRTANARPGRGDARQPRRRPRAGAAAGGLTAAVDRRSRTGARLGGRVPARAHSLASSR